MHGGTRSLAAIVQPLCRDGVACTRRAAYGLLSRTTTVQAYDMAGSVLLQWSCGGQRRGWLLPKGLTPCRDVATQTGVLYHTVGRAR